MPTIAVFSDLHAVQWFSSETDRKSWLARGVPNDPRKNPLTGALNIIDSLALTADILVCPGDIGNEANPDGIALGWEAVNALAQSLGAATIAATPGNHDLDCRCVGASGDHQYLRCDA